MRDIVTDLVHLFFTLPFYVVVALVVAAAISWRKRRGEPFRRWRYLLTLLAVGMFVVSLPVVPNAMVRQVETHFPVPGDRELAPLASRGDAQILVLSGGWFRRTEGGYEVEMGSNSWERTWTAVTLWRRIGGTLIFSGAPLPDGSDSVAQRMAEVARQLGVPADKVRVETRSRNTFENLVLTQREVLSRDPGRPVVLLTSALHMPRSVAIAERLGLQVLPYPCNFRSESRMHWRMWLPGNDGLGNIEEALHELVGLLAYRLRGWA